MYVCMYVCAHTYIHTRGSTPTVIQASGLTELLPAELDGVLAEALTADVEAVLADKTVSVGANAALAAALGLVLGVGVPDVGLGHGYCRETESDRERLEETCPWDGGGVDGPVSHTSRPLTQSGASRGK